MEEFGEGEKEGIFFSFKILIIYASHLNVYQGIQVEFSNKDEARFGTSCFHFTSAEAAQPSLQVSFLSNMTQGFAWFIHFLLSLARESSL
jgi:hypothetical protein